jgi:RNA 3'-terminal phosphate cyclase (ATP)
MIEIDGSQGEGGGQILRTALAASIITGQPVHIGRIRAGRRKPGLAAQHLAGVLAAAKISKAAVSGAKIGSTEVTFQPGGAAQSGDYHFDISIMAGRGSAGAVTLLLQSILLPLAFADGPSRVTIRGGTHVPLSPPAHFAQHVLLPALARMGLRATLDHTQWGWYPLGGGEMALHVDGSTRLKGLTLTERGDVRQVIGLAAASNLPSHIPQRIADRANRRLQEVGLKPGVQARHEGGNSTGVGVSIVVDYGSVSAGFSALGEKGKPSEAVADEAVDALLAHHRQGAPVDPHLADQLLLAMAFADGPSAMTTSQITRHSRTTIDVIHLFTPRRFQVDGSEGESGTVTVS